MTARSDIKLFMRLEPDIPKLTHQNGIKTRVVNGHAQVYKTPALRDLEAKYISLLKSFAPTTPWNCPISLTTRWSFNRPKGCKGIFKTTKPDTDNLVKTLKDCMTRCGFWTDDALVVAESCVKWWVGENDPHGVFIMIEDYSGFNA